MLQSEPSTSTLPSSPSSAAPRAVADAATKPTTPVRLQHPVTVSNRIVWRYAVPIVTVHLLAPLVFIPWLFSWTGVVALVAGIYFYGAIGINICYHRLLTHRSFRCPLWLEHCFTTVAICCLEDAPGSWVATHRLHHNDSDERPDPHTPRAGFWWSHMGWLMFENRSLRNTSAYEKYARDVLRDPYYMRLQRTLLQGWIYLAHMVLYFAAGFVIGRVFVGGLWSGLQMGLSLVVWGCIVRTVCVWHITWSVNSLSHVFGYQTYDTRDDSRNNWLVAFIASGEGWHNNHHQDPASASNWHRWWEIDPMWMIIRGLEMVGLASEVIRPRHIRKSQ